jgi:5-(aminomethyl)-3-furanmethanol phosphate kinase
MSDRVVVKLGGSLLVQSETPAKLRHWLADQFSDAQVNLIVGGGRMIDSLRELDLIHAFDEVAMHWRCVRALRLTSELASEWLPNAHRVTTCAEFNRHRNSNETGVFLIAVDTFYSPDDGDRLPQSWSTTSDSIAALLANKLLIDKLWLLKSCAVADDLSVEQAIRLGIVDEAFGKLSESLQVSWATL